MATFLLLALVASFEFVPQLGHAVARDVKATPDGEWVAVAGDRSVKLWRKDGVLIRDFSSFDSDVSTVGVSADGSLIAGASATELKLFRRNGSLVGSSKGEHAQSELLFDADGSHLVLVSDNGVVFFDTKALTQTSQHRKLGGVQWVGFVDNQLYFAGSAGWMAFDHTGTPLLTAPKLDKLKSTSINKGEHFKAFYDVSVIAKPLGEEPKGGQVMEFRVQALDPQNGRMLTHENLAIWNPKKNDISGGRLCVRQPNGERLTCQFTGEIRRIDWQSTRWLDMRASLAGERLYTIGDGSLLIADVATGQRITFGARPRQVERLVHLPDGRIVSALSNEVGNLSPNTLNVWSADGRLEKRIELAATDNAIDPSTTNNPLYLADVRSLLALDADRVLVSRYGGATMLVQLSTGRVTPQPSAEELLPCRGGVFGAVKRTGHIEVRRCTSAALVGTIPPLPGNQLVYDVVGGADQKSVLLITKSKRFDEKTQVFTKYTFGKAGALDQSPFVVPPTARWLRGPQVIVEHTAHQAAVFDANGKLLRELKVPALRQAVPLLSADRYVSHDGQALHVQDGQGQKICTIAFTASNAYIYSVDSLGTRALRITLRTPSAEPQLVTTESCQTLPQREWMSADGDLLAGKGADRGSISLLKLGSTHEVMLYAFSDEWAALTNDNGGGYYDSSPQAGRYLAMSFNDTSFAIDQFAVRFNRPDVILSRLGASPEAVAWYRRLYDRRLKKLGLTDADLGFDFAVPVARITSSKKIESTAQLEMSFEDKEQDLVSYQVYANDVPLLAAEGAPLSGRQATASISVALLNGTNKIEVSARNRLGRESFRSPVVFVHQGSDKGALHVVTVGVSKYRDPALSLRYAAKDARDFATLAQRFRAYSKVITHSLFDEQVTPEALRALRDKLVAASPHDSLVVLVAGHGVHDRDEDNTFYYLTHGANLASLSTTAARFADIEMLLQGVPQRRKLLLLDTCESGELDEADFGSGPTLVAGGLISRGIKRPKGSAAVHKDPPRRYLLERERFIYNDLLRRTGAVVMSSSRGGELSYERNDLQNGVFTHSLMRALATPALDVDRDGWLDTRELLRHVADDVAKKTQGMQNPTIDRDNLQQRVALPLTSR